MNKQIEIREELNTALKNVAEILLKTRNPMNSWYIQNAMARLSESEHWVIKALDEYISEPRKDVKFANKFKKSIANKQ